MERICGFIVVRKPEFAQNEMVRPNLSIGEKVYRGVDRLPWEDFDLAYYEKRLPAPLLPIWQGLDRDTNDFSGLPLLKDYQKVIEVLHFSGDKSEVIAIWSPELDETKGTMNCDLGLNYLGIDCCSMGEWSVLANGVYAHPELFPGAVAQLNTHGLLTSEAECDATFERYLALAETEAVEPLMKAAKATNIKVFELADLGG